MIEITTGTIEEKIIKILQKTYPITVKCIKQQLHCSEQQVLRVLQKLQNQGVIILDILPDTIFVRLLRRDVRFIGKKRQKKFIKHKSSGKKYEPPDYEGIMYS